jgi:hypothetical protein
MWSATVHPCRWHTSMAGWCQVPNGLHGADCESLHEKLQLAAQRVKMNAVLALPSQYYPLIYVYVFLVVFLLQVLYAILFPPMRAACIAYFPSSLIRLFEQYESWSSCIFPLLRPSYVGLCYDVSANLINLCGMRPVWPHISLLYPVSQAYFVYLWFT